MNGKEKRIMATCAAVFVVFFGGWFLCQYFGGANYNDDVTVQHIEEQQQSNIKRARTVHEDVSATRALNERARANIRETKQTLAKGRNAIERIGIYAEENERIFQDVCERAETGTK